MDTIGIAFLGISHPHSSGRYRVFEQVPDVEIVGAWDAEAATLASFTKEVGANPVSLEMVLADKSIHGVVVHSGSVDMARLGALAHNAGKAVLVEKPGGADLADLRELAESEAQNPHQPIRVGYNFHYGEAFAKAKKMLAENAIGRISIAHVHGASITGEELSQHLNNPADMGGGLWVIGCHQIHLLIELLGFPTGVRATVAKLPTRSNERSQEDIAALTLVYPDKLVSFTFTVYDRMSFYETSTLTLYGEDGLLRFGVLPGFVEICGASDHSQTPGQWTRWSEGSFADPFVGRPSPYSELPQIGNLSFFEREAAEWISAIRGAPGAGVTAADALQVAQVIKAAYESSKCGGLEVDPRL